jgi:hypothetical protein
MRRRRSPFVYTRPINSIAEPWRTMTDGDGNIVHHAFIGGERVPGIEVISIEYQGPRYGLGYHYELRGAPEAGRFKRASDAVHAAARINREVMQFLSEHGEPNAGYGPDSINHFSWRNLARR